MESKMPSLPVLDNCCGCVDLKLGCFILAYLNLAGILFIIGFNVLIMVAAIVVFATNSVALTLIIIISITLFFFLIDLAFSIVLLIGLHKEKPGYLKAFLIYNMMFLALYITQFIITSATTIMSVFMIIQNIIFILFLAYILLVIRSMYVYMADAPANKAPHMGVPFGKV